MGHPHGTIGEEDHGPGQQDCHLRHAGRPVWEGGHRVDDSQEPENNNNNLFIKYDLPKTFEKPSRIHDRVIG